MADKLLEVSSRLSIMLWSWDRLQSFSITRRDELHIRLWLWPSKRGFWICVKLLG